MKRFAALLITLAIAYCAYWFFMAGQIKSAAPDIITDFSQQGYSVTHDPIKVRGFPLAFKTPSMALGVTSTAQPIWSAQFEAASLRAKAYAPFSQTVSITGPARFETPAFENLFYPSPARLDFTAQAETLDLVMSQSPLSDTVKTKANISQLRLTPISGDLPLLGVSDGHYTAATDPNTYSATFAFHDVSLNADMLGQITRALGGNITTMDGDIAMTFGADFQGRKIAQHLKSDQFSLMWGKADIIGSFDVTPSARGALSGDVKLSLDDPQALTARLASVGILSREQQFGINLALATGGKDAEGRTNLTIKVAENRLTLNGIPIGNLPF